MTWSRFGVESDLSDGCCLIGDRDLDAFVTNNYFALVLVNDGNFADLDDDGDLDAVVGEVNGQMLTFSNDNRRFVSLSGTDNPFSSIDVGFVSTPTFVDLEGDGDLDLFSGSFSGTISFYRNDGGQFVEQIGTANPFDGVDVGCYSNIAFAALDGDGDEDGFLGLEDGTVAYYENSGGRFTQVTGTDNPLNGIDAGQFSFPGFADMDGDGDEDERLGEVFGRVRVYRNEGDSFTALTGSSNPLEEVRVGFYTAPSFADLDSDGAIGGDFTLEGDSRGRVTFLANPFSDGGASLTVAQGTELMVGRLLKASWLGENLGSVIDIDR